MIDPTAMAHWRKTQQALLDAKDAYEKVCGYVSPKAEQREFARLMRATQDHLDATVWAATGVKPEPPEDGDDAAGAAAYPVDEWARRGVTERTAAELVADATVGAALGEG